MAERLNEFHNVIVPQCGTWSWRVSPLPERFERIEDSACGAVPRPEVRRHWYFDGQCFRGKDLGKNGQIAQDMLLHVLITRTASARIFVATQILETTGLYNEGEWLLLVVHGRACEPSALGIGSARGHRPALPVVGYDNPARNRNHRALFHREI